MILEQGKYFGTDGIRGKVGASVINPEFVLKLGWAAGMALREEGSVGSAVRRRVLIGKDTRISGYLLESVLEAGLASAGIDSLLLGPMPTPAIAYLTRTLRAEAGIVVSASHNPYYDNGIKLFSGAGCKISDHLEETIEKYLALPMQIVDAGELGKATRVNDAQGRYIEFCKSTLGLSRNLSGLKIVLDCANGATYKVAPAVFSELGAEVLELGTSPDGFNINERCGSTYPEVMAKIVQAENADLGIAFDGDGDRVIMADHKGEIVNGDELLFIMATHGFLQRSLTGGIIGTVMSNYGLEQSLAKLKIPFERTKVGDKYVVEALRTKGWLLGGEASGHIVHCGITTSGDGIISALQVLAALRDKKCTLHELKSEMVKFPQVLINVRTDKKISSDALEKSEALQSTVLEVEEKLGSLGRVLIRASGTEPLVRVMVEGAEHKLANECALRLADVVKKCILDS